MFSNDPGSFEFINTTREFKEFGKRYQYKLKQKPCRYRDKNPEQDAPARGDSQKKYSINKTSRK
jgi:hypothetical protein